jgi:uncharacterized protein (TIGR02757 family)
MRNKANIKRSLERLFRTYGPEHLHTDPLKYPHMFRDPGDREVAGFLSAVFAYGQVAQIQAALDRIFSPFSGRICRTLLDTPPARWREVHQHFAYRFQDQEDLVQMLGLLRRILEEHGSIENSFLPHYQPVEEQPDAIRLALSGWVRSLRARLPARHPEHGKTTHRGIFHLLADPASGSPCKRWNLYLRWMVRGPDGMDLGLWKSVSPRKLILPLDTHTARISRYLGFTDRSSPSWAMAEEITRALRVLDPEDPVRYDFSIARLGILSRCTRRPLPNQCPDCELNGICLQAAAGAHRGGSGPRRKPQKRRAEKTDRGKPRTR